MTIVTGQYTACRYMWLTKFQYLLQQHTYIIVLKMCIMCSHKKVNCFTESSSVHSSLGCVSYISKNSKFEQQVLQLPVCSCAVSTCFW